MKHIGLYCPAETGHLHTMLPLGQGLQKKAIRSPFLAFPTQKPK
ncbi:hypothetical protein CWATWH0005_3561 [Crocosphaera watsonii WH 0005]|uniref:Uncharacterized protein n=1 Tax=Crocosphaera watsonii WH 0005 TaxID=423472 RepID=T2IVX6_CROWT|nr:hypothetical protein CWATWH0005_3561 [Crocosphaera watsonii WH 0005]